MAIGCCYSTNIVIPRRHATKTMTATSGPHRSRASPKASLRINSTSCSMTKFQAFGAEMGVVSYIDQNGEMVCERYDEGPRYLVQPEERRENQRRSCRQRDVQIQQLLKLQCFRDPELDCSIHVDSASISGFPESTV